MNKKAITLIYSYRLQVKGVLSKGRAFMIDAFKHWNAQLNKTDAEAKATSRSWWKYIVIPHALLHIQITPTKHLLTFPAQKGGIWNMAFQTGLVRNLKCASYCVLLQEETVLYEKESSVKMSPENFLRVNASFYHCKWVQRGVKQLNHQTEICIEQTCLHREYSEYLLIYLLDMLEVISILQNSSHLFISLKCKNGHSYKYSSWSFRQQRLLMSTTAELLLMCCFDIHGAIITPIKTGIRFILVSLTDYCWWRDLLTEIGFCQHQHWLNRINLCTENSKMDLFTSTVSITFYNYL